MKGEDVMRLVCHINDDGDLLEAWLKHYIRLGISSFHLIVHGSEEENSVLLALKDRYPIIIEDWYGGDYLSKEKARRVNVLLKQLEGEWIVLVDSDEFLELPYGNFKRTVQFLKRTRSNMLWAPMVQRVSRDGSLVEEAEIHDPCKAFPLCNPDLYNHMGSDASISKFPVFLCKGAELQDSGNHQPPLGARSIVSLSKGATHHFKWRSQGLGRIRKRMDTDHEWRQESEIYFSYLSRHRFMLPTGNAFRYSRQAMFRQGLLIRFPPTWGNLVYIATNFREVLGMVSRRVHFTVPFRPDSPKNRQTG